MKYLAKERQMVLESARKAQNFGLSYPTSGNFSMINRELGMVAVTPRGLDRNAITAEELIVVDMDKNIVEGPEGCVPSSETGMHLDIYKARPDVMAVSHTHSPYVTVFAALKREILPVLFEANRFDFRCPVAPFARTGDPKLAENIIEALGPNGLAVLIASHGAVTVSQTDIDDAFIKSLYLEDVARAHYRVAAMVGLDNVTHMPLDELDDIMVQLGRRTAKR